MKELRKELEKQTDALNSIFENKTDYRLKEGKTSLFIESKTDEEQVQAHVQGPEQDVRQDRPARSHGVRPKPAQIFKYLFHSPLASLCKP